MATIITNPETIKLLSMRTQLQALYLEIKGIRYSKGSICSFIRKTYNIRTRLKKDVYREFHQIILAKEKELGIPERPLNYSEKEILGM